MFKEKTFEGQLAETINLLENKITDLEAKLAESEKRFQAHKQVDCHTIQEQTDLIEELKQQLTEKEKEIEKLNTQILVSQLQAPKEQILNILGSQCIQYNPQQDKISFCIEKLEKVKKFVIRQLFITTKDCSDLDKAEAKGCNELREETIKEIDNQIKQLKEMK